MIEAVGVGKAFGGIEALRDVDLTVPAGSVLCLLGHNGAGKTTLVNILSTVFPPGRGTARVAGFNVVREAREVRRRIGLTGQFAAVDEGLSGRDNLLLVARLLGAGRREARGRANELLGLFGLEEAAGRKARSYSGGMRRRLDLACGLVGNPEVLFLDEPSTGLDPEARLGLWEVVEGLIRDGTTVLLTTQHLEEAERLADRIAVLSAGRIVAFGTPAELKARVGRLSATVSLASPSDAPRATRALEGAGLIPVHDEARGALVTSVNASGELASVVRALDGAGVEAAGLALAEPTLEDVYLALACPDPSTAA